jgi:hypothetical protein
MSDYRLTLKIQNGRLYRTMRENGFNTVAELCRACGASQERVGKLLNLKLRPRGKDGEYLKVVRDVCSVLCEPPEALFPDDMDVVIPAARLSAFVSAVEVRKMIGTTVDPAKLLEQAEESNHNLTSLHKALSYLSFREREIIVAQARGVTTGELANRFNTVPTRIAELRNRGYRRLCRAMVFAE